MGDDTTPSAEVSASATNASPAKDAGTQAPPEVAEGRRTHSGLSRRWMLLGFALSVAGLIGTLTISRTGGPAGRVVGGNVPVNPPATDTGDVSAFNSPALQANPVDSANLVVADRVDTPVTTCAVQVSADGGATWSPVPIVFPPGKAVPCFSPDVAFGADGTVYLAFSTFGAVPGQGTVPDGLWLTTSTNEGRNFGPPRQVRGPIVLQVHLVADPTVAQRLYLTWLQASQTGPWGLLSTSDPLVVARSDDGGATWGTPVRASGPGRLRTVAPSLAVGPRGELVLAYLDVGDDRLDYAGDHAGKGGDPYPKHWSLIAARSDDEGASWTESVVDGEIVPTQRFLMLSPPAPAVAVDRRRGRTYLAFHDGRLGDADVWLWRSSDGGRRWGPAHRVNDTRRRDGTSQYLPALGVAPDGRVDVVYYDRRNDPRDVTTEVSLQSSFDGGNTFGSRVQLSDRGFDSGIGSGAARGMPELGDRLGIVSVDTGALAIWTDTRAGTRQNGKQDLARAVAVIRRPSGWRPLVRDGAQVLIVIGLLLVGSTLVRWVARLAREARVTATSGAEVIGTGPGVA